jgi:RNA polymerase sigma factor (sigma-70 family)
MPKLHRHTDHPLDTLELETRWNDAGSAGTSGYPALGDLGLASRDDRTDDLLAARAAAGDDRAFELLVQRQRPRLVAIAGRVVRDGRAEDAVQVALLSAYRSLRSGGAPRSVDAWLTVLTRNAAIDQIRRTPDSAPMPAHEVGVSASAGAVAEDRAELRRVLSAVSELPGNERDALLLRAVTGAGHEEIGEQLDVSTGQARQLIHRARRRVREMAAILIPAWFAVRVHDAKAEGLRLAELGSNGTFAAPTRAAGAIAAACVATAAAGVGVPVAVHEIHQHERAVQARDAGERSTGRVGPGGTVSAVGGTITGAGATTGAASAGAADAAAADRHGRSGTSDDDGSDDHRGSGSSSKHGSGSSDDSNTSNSHGSGSGTDDSSPSHSGSASGSGSGDHSGSDANSSGSGSSNSDKGSDTSPTSGKGSDSTSGSGKGSGSGSGSGKTEDASSGSGKSTTSTSGSGSGKTESSSGGGKGSDDATSSAGTQAPAAASGSDDSSAAASSTTTTSTTASSAPSTSGKGSDDSSSGGTSGKGSSGKSSDGSRSGEDD